MKISLLMVALTWLLLSCSAEQELILDAEGGGRVAVSFVLPVYLLDQAAALQQNLPPGTPDFFDPEALKEQLMANSALQNVMVEAPQRHKMNISWTFTNLNQMLKGSTAVQNTALMRQVVRLNEKSDGSTRLELRLTRRNYEQLLADNPILDDNPVIQYYGPSITSEVSRQDYYDLIAFAFGEEARAALDKANLQLNITVPRAIRKIEGGRIVSPRRARFQIKLIDLLYFDGTDLYALEY